MNVRFTLLVGFFSLGFSAAAVAEIYKCTDDSGVATFTDNPRSVTNKHCTSMNLEPMIINAPSPGKKSKVTSSARSVSRPAPQAPGSFPSVDAGTQQKRDVTRRQVLEDEMATEQKLLADSQRNLEGSQRQNDVSRIAQYRNEVIAHQKNVEALQKELQRLK